MWFIVFRVYCAFVWVLCEIVDALLYSHPEIWGQVPPLHRLTEFPHDAVVWSDVSSDPHAMM
jgi:hypothetical protein